MSFIVHFVLHVFWYFLLFYIICLSVCLYVLFVCLWAMLSESNKMYVCNKVDNFKPLYSIVDEEFTALLCTICIIPTVVYTACTVCMLFHDRMLFP